MWLLRRTANCSESPTSNKETLRRNVEEMLSWYHIQSDIFSRSESLTTQ